MLVSVIIPNYNHSSYLKQRIESVLNQTYQEIEIIILDDCSLDDSQQIVEQYRNHPKVRHILFNDKNSGSPFSQWQKGMKFAKGQIIWIAESDDYCEPTFIESLLPEFSDKSVGITFCSSHWVDAHGNIKEDLSLYFQSFKAVGQEILINKMVYTCIIPNVSSALIRKSFIRKSGFDLSRFRYCGDWMFYSDLLMRSNISFVNKKLNYFRWYHSNSSNEAIKLGKWTDEGVHVLQFLSQNNYLTLGRIYILFKEWTRRINKLPGFKRRLKLKKILISYSILGTIHFSMNWLSKKLG